MILGSLNTDLENKLYVACVIMVYILAAFLGFSTSPPKYIIEVFITILYILHVVLTIIIYTPSLWVCGYIICLWAMRRCFEYKPYYSDNNENNFGGESSV